MYSSSALFSCRARLLRGGIFLKRSRLGAGRFSASSLQLPEFSGGYTAGVTPVPIPNTVVKPRWADDTARVTVWGRRSPPGLKKPRAGFACCEFGPFVFPNHSLRLHPNRLV